MAYCAWSTDVNKIILDSTNVTVGDGAVVQDALEAGGLKKSRLTCSNPPDKYNVTMAFDFVEKKMGGYTELELFWAWYKHVHKYGSVPFEFPAVLMNSNRQQGYSQDEIESIAARLANHQEIDPGDIPQTEYYCITSAVNGTKSGNSMQVTMTWETYATGVIQVSEEAFSVESIEAGNGWVDVVMSSKPAYEPNKATWSVICTPNLGTAYALTITGCLYDGAYAARLFFDGLPTGRYTLRVLNRTDILVVS